MMQIQKDSVGGNVHLTRDRKYLLLSAALFFSNFGSVMLLMSLSLKTFVETGSSFLAGAVYGSQWLIPLLFVPIVGWVANRFSVNQLMRAVQAFSIVITLLVSFCYPIYLVPFFGLMAVRGILEAISKSAASVALKLYMPVTTLEKASSYYDTNRYISSALASLVGMLLLENMSIEHVSIISSLSFLVAIGCYSYLPSLQAIDAGQPLPKLSYWRETAAILRSKPDLRRCFINLCIVTGGFQGFYYMARSAIPIGQLGLSIGIAAFVQALISLAFTAGAMFVARFLMEGSTLNRIFPAALQVILGVIFMMSCVMTVQPIISIGLFLLCLFVYEIFYTKNNNKLMIECSSDEISHISSAKYGALTFSMLLVIFVCGGLADWIGFVYMVKILSVIVVVLYFSLNFDNFQMR